MVSSPGTQVRAQLSQGLRFHNLLLVLKIILRGIYIQDLSIIESKKTTEWATMVLAQILSVLLLLE